jgi:phage protein D
LDGTGVADSLYDMIDSIEVEENADRPGALQLRMPIARTESGELSAIHEAIAAPMANVALVARVDGAEPECLFEGFVLSQSIHVDAGLTAAYADVYAQDASWLLEQEFKSREWADVSDETVANRIFNEYGISPASENTQQAGSTHSAVGHTLMQCGSDHDFLRRLARRSGRYYRVVGSGSPPSRIGYFAKPNIGSAPVATLRPHDPDAANVDSLDITWDITRPTRVNARQALFTDASAEGADGGADSSGLSAMDELGLSDFAGAVVSTALSAPVDDSGDLKTRSQSTLQDAGWFVRCEGETDPGVLGRVLRTGTVVAIEGMGSMHSGNYFVWSVRHILSAERHRMRFVLLRNAVGPAPSSDSWGF